jgi:hypothetical protein
MSLTANKNIDIIAIGSPNWGVPINDNSEIIDKAFGGFATVIGTSGNITLAPDVYQNMCIKTGAPAFLANVTFIIPSGVKGQWLFQNQSGVSNFSLLVKNAASSDFIAISRGQTQTVYSDGTTVLLTSPAPVTVEFFDSGTGVTYTPRPGTRALRVTCVGGGGGGGAVDGQGTGTAAAAGGGGSGGITEILINSLSASYTYTVGAGGSGAAGGTGTGGAGGTTTFEGGAVLLSAGGGGGGQGRLASSSAVAASGGGGGTASGGSLNTRGATGFAGQVTAGGTTAGQGTGGSSAYGAGGAGDFVSGSVGGGVGGAAPLGFGGGGGGASVAGQQSNYGGGDGTGGLIIVEEFA